MLRNTFKRYQQLRAPVKALAFLYWIYIFTGAMLGVFTQLFLYERFSSITFNIFSALSLFTGTMVGFVICGYLASLFHLNIKHGFASSFIINALSVLMLLYSTGEKAAILVMLLSGIGLGLFWLTLHTFELTETRDEERDFYSSILAAGTQILSLAGPALATLLLWLSGTVLHFGNFTLLFTVVPIIYMLGFFCFANLRDYHPKKVMWHDIVHFFTDRRNRLSQLYMLGTGFQHVLGMTIPPLAVLFILGSVLRVGIYNTYLALFTTLCVLVLAHYRNQANRLKIFGIATGCIVLLTVYFGYTFTFSALIIYAIGAGILSPILRVSAHVIDLQTMESIGHGSSDFYATMLFRDFSLWVWRSLSAVVFLILAHNFVTEKEYLVGGTYMLAASLAITFLGAKILVASMAKSGTFKGI